MDHEFEIFVKYQDKNFSECLDLIDSITDSSGSSTRYKVLKAACFVSLKKRIDEAHNILDEVLISEDGNALAHYSKGLAFYEQGKLNQAIEYFGKAIEHNKTGSMERARKMKAKAEKTLKQLAAAKGETSGEAENKIEPEGENVDEQEESPSKGINFELARNTAKVVNDESKEDDSAEMSTEKKNRCGLCDKTFSRTFSLTRHMQGHTGERPNKCEKCSYACIQKSDLKRHMATHSLDFNHECSKCDKKFKTRKNLQAHQMTHIMERPFQCRSCPKTFKLINILKFHESLHKPITTLMFCDLCGKPFSAKAHLKSHIKTHSNEQPFGCNLCKVTFKTIARMGLHFREYHGVGKAKV